MTRKILAETGAAAKRCPGAELIYRTADAAAELGNPSTTQLQCE
jgi:hypothetical protein